MSILATLVRCHEEDVIGEIRELSIWL